MIPLSANQLAEIMGAAVVAGNPQVEARGGVSIDTRKMPQGCIFFGLRGEQQNGGVFAARALADGAAVAVVDRWEGVDAAGGAVLQVGDPLLAMQKLAFWWRKQLEIPVVAITGSNGKTSTKDLTAAVLGGRFKVAATSGNFNNHIGVPLSVLEAGPEHTAAVWEIGMNHAGELAPLCEIIRPKYGVITNIGSAHIEFFGSREAIAEEKGTLARALPADGILFLPACCEFHEYLRQRSKASLISVGNGRGVVRAEGLRMEADRSIFNLVIDGESVEEVEMPVPGRHMVTNALLAAGVGWKLGVPVGEIAERLAGARLTGGRLHRRDWGGVTLIDDTYNANPESMAAAIDTLADWPVVANGRRIIVLGRMGELGSHAAAAHLKVGELAAQRKLAVVAVGEGAEGIAQGAGGARYFPEVDAAAEWLAGTARAGDVILFKGSRSARVERIMNTAFPRD